MKEELYMKFFHGNGLKSLNYAVNPIQGGGGGDCAPR